MAGEVRGYHDLRVWQLSMDFAEAIYRMTWTFPDREKFSMANQLQRAAMSVPSNIAEGHGRESAQDFARFLAIARGSLSELETQLKLSSRVGLLGEEQLTATLGLANDVGALLAGLQRSLRNSQPGTGRDRSERR